MAFDRGAARAADTTYRIPDAWQRMLDEAHRRLEHPDEGFRPHTLEEPTEEDLERQRQNHRDEVCRHARWRLQDLEPGKPITLDIHDDVLVSVVLRPPRERVAWFDKMGELLPEQVRLHPDGRLEPIYGRRINYVGYYAPQYYEERGMEPGWLDHTGAPRLRID